MYRSECVVGDQILLTNSDEPPYGLRVLLDADYVQSVLCNWALGHQKWNQLYQMEMCSISNTLTSTVNVTATRECKSAGE